MKIVYIEIPLMQITINYRQFNVILPTLHQWKLGGICLLFIKFHPIFGWNITCYFV